LLSKIKNYITKIQFINFLLVGVIFLSIILGFMLIEQNRWDGFDISIIIMLFSMLGITFLMKFSWKSEFDGVTLEMLHNRATNNIVDKNNSSIDILNIQNISLNSIKIKNYFSIKNIEITNLQDKKEIYFVGENGDGKTILLQAILLSLKKEYSGVVLEHFKEVKDVELSVQYEKFTENDKVLNIQNVFAYGINRNKVHYSDFDKYGYGGLFDTSDSRRTTYLKDPFYELGKKYQGKNPVIKEFIKVLNSQILQENHKIFDGGDVNFTELSEGYKSTIIWLYDLVSRLTENQKEIKKLKDFKAIVLIDEVDLYLHPKWKYDFVHTLRKIFPNIQFIMITHSIVTLLGASREAVFYKVYKENGETKISNQIANEGYTHNSLASSPLFDLDTITSREYENRRVSSDDYVYDKIHQAVSARIKEEINTSEEDIMKLINEELDKL